MIYRITGFLLLIETALLLCCAGVSLIYGEDDLNSFLLSAGLTTLVGILLLAVGKGAEKQLNRRDGYVIVSVAWVVFSSSECSRSTLAITYQALPTPSLRQCQDSAVPEPPFLTT